MSAQNVEIVRDAVSAWNRQDEGAVARLCSTDLRIDASDRVLNPDTYAGVRGLMRFRDEIAETWDRFELEVEELFDAGDEVVAFVRSVGRGRSSGAEVDFRSAWLVRLSAHRIVSLRLYRDRAQALEATGLLGA